MKISVSKILVGIAMLITMTIPATVMATSSEFSFKTSGSVVDSAGGKAGLTGTTDLSTIVGKLIGVILGILGIVFVILVVYAGFLYLTAQGDETNVKKAKKMLTEAVIGLAIIVAAYAITSVVTNGLTTLTTTPAAPVVAAPSSYSTMEK